ncbi:MAG: response regulator transcription factor [Ktedonobacteraceae bacterium]|nr:response regulator transcription factor [Ktedonobacteraceae bacterium]
MKQVLQRLLHTPQDAPGNAVDRSRAYILMLLQVFEQETSRSAGQLPCTSPPAASAFTPLPTPAISSLMEPLTPQEQRILRLLVAGRSTQEIAYHLVISRNTVKTHVRHLYGKLGVHNRMQASARARDLHLL